jgi:hypothetical protein
LNTVLQNDYTATIIGSAQFADTLESDNGRAMNAVESLRIESRFKGMHARGEEVDCRARMQAHVISIGLDPIHVIHIDENCSLVAAHGEPSRVT